MKTLGNIKQCLESKLLDVQIELTNYHAPDDGSTSLGAIVRDAYTGRTLLSLEWYYDFECLMSALNQEMAVLARRS